LEHFSQKPELKNSPHAKEGGCLEAAPPLRGESARKIGFRAFLLTLHYIYITIVNNDMNLCLYARIYSLFSLNS
jgi:hypothetical protein